MGVSEEIKDNLIGYCLLIIIAVIVFIAGYKIGDKSNKIANEIVKQSQELYLSNQSVKFDTSGVEICIRVNSRNFIEYENQAKQIQEMMTFIAKEQIKQNEFLKKYLSGTPDRK